MDTSQIIKNLGGNNKIAELTGLTKSAISQWRKRGIPPAWNLYLKRIRPSAFKGAK